MKDKYHITLKELLIKREITLKHHLSSQEKALLTKEFDLKNIDSLDVDLTLFPICANKGIAVRGKINAKVIHYCVVTLESVLQSIQETIYVHFTPTGDDDMPAILNQKNLSDFDLSQEYDIEKLENGEVNLLDIIREHLALSLLTLPRVENAHFSGYVSGDLTDQEKEMINKNINLISEGKMPVSAENPFLCLKALKEQIK